MEITDRVLSGVRDFLNVGDSNVFDGEILPHVMVAIGVLSQIGVGRAQVVTDTTTWQDIINSYVIDDPEVFTMVPLYIMLSTKILFDPPPPSTLEYYQSRMDETIWRLKTIYDNKKDGIANE